jgi:hypothetical protein
MYLYAYFCFVLNDDECYRGKYRKEGMQEHCNFKQETQD